VVKHVQLGGVKVSLHALNVLRCIESVAVAARSGGFVDFNMLDVGTGSFW
jgi:hypothetical protein